MTVNAVHDKCNALFVSSNCPRGTPRYAFEMPSPLPPNAIESAVRNAVATQPVIDIHTHLYTPAFGSTLEGASGRSPDSDGLLLWGLDELLVYHYLVAEMFRVVPADRLSYEQFWAMPKSAQADLIWKELFIERSPISEACRGVLTTLQKLGLDPADRDLSKWRKHFAATTPSKHIDKCMELAGVTSLTMTNAVFDDNERNRWLADAKVGTDPRFTAVLRFDPILRNWPDAAKKMASWGYKVDATSSNSTIEEARRFLRDWLDRTKSIYMAVSLPPAWRYPAPENDPVAKLGQAMLEKVVLPVAAERGLPFAMMIGSTLQVNPALRAAGDTVEKSDVTSLVRLLQAFPQNKFLVTMLSRENQHELCVTARKFRNLMIFGCWWFLNNPVLIDEMTRMRFELLGTSFIPQHSDARVLDQIIYKWDHSRKIIADVLVDKYNDIAAAGWNVTAEEIARDVRDLFRDNFVRFLGR